MRVGRGRTISTGFTPLGQLYLRITEGCQTIIRTTKDPLEFLRLLLGLPEDESQRETQQDSAPHKHSYDCHSCHGDFASGGGAVIAGQLFCTRCIDGGQHFEFFKAMNLKDGYINYLTENRMKYL
jgi:hypothetical protein